MIIDCFTFYNELELLEIRLHYLDSVVDHFVLCESVLTHSGNNKPLFFNENKLLFKPFWSKIVHVIVDDMPNPGLGDRWVLENYQRNCILKGLEQIKPEPNDYILISDMDEIPRRELVERQHTGVYDQRCFMYYLNTQNELHWTGTVGLPYDKLKNHYGNPQKVRDQRNQMEPIRDGGWHFGWLGGYDRVYQKIKAFAHEEIDQPYIMDHLKESVDNCCALWSPGGGSIQVVPIDDTYPDYIINNQDKFRHLIRGRDL